MKQALLCVSFGTSVERARPAITAVEDTLRETAPERVFARAFTSSIIRRVLAGRGEEVPGVTEALETLLAQGIEDVAVQPTHILYGNEYDKLAAEADSFRDRFRLLRIGRPLLADSRDLRTLAAALDAAYPRRAGEALVLFGHGTDHFANAAYPALQTAFRLMGREDVLVGTVEGWPVFDDICMLLERGGCSAVHLVPLMLVAGDHAMNDMAGDGPDSWRSRMEAAGYRVRCTMDGLGLLPAVRRMYREHLETL